MDAESTAHAWWLLVLAGACLLFTLNALRPIYWNMVISVLSFFGGWPTMELALHHVAWQAALVAYVLWQGTAVATWPGQLALGLFALNWIGLLYLARQGYQSRALANQVLASVLGEDAPLERPARAPDTVPTWPPAGPPQLTLLLPWPFIPRSVERLGNLPYAEMNGRTLRLDVYRPRRRSGPCPTLLWLHGGGWVVGSKRDQGRVLMHHLAANGWLCVSVQYRRSPRAVFPDHLLDAKQALRWVREQGAEYGADPDFVVAAGGSAGGQIASLLALTPNAPEYQADFPDVDTAVQACVPLYGVYDMADHEGLGNPGLPWLVETAVIRQKRDAAPELFAEASPITRLGPHAPPFLLVHGTGDTMVPVPSARRFIDEFERQATAPLTYLELPGAQHAFDLFHSPRANVMAAGVRLWLEHRRKEDGDE